MEHLSQAGAVSDLETRLTADHHQSLRLWLRMLSCTVLIEDEIRSRLRNEFDITLPRFDLMAQLERYPDGLRMGELSKRMMVTGGNITGITNQLEQEQLVRRVPDPRDGRVYQVQLTEQGRQAFTRMAAVHEGWIAELFAAMPVADKNQLSALLGSLKKHLNPAGSATYPIAEE
ncbi:MULTISPECIES: MarR family transcriptional regulator [unclassified Undibacterium]|uniref:MarR family winged helix-turn-helix transcriptional regulator n=1 Tax=unclassified Undibacterium TaxID=2630295 RepID=UPI002AC8F8C7|nr:MULTISPECIES: MarR family transcriptional regulator [unclassified Undibacterium]MEB0138689.1 MarR family transcriptional regulator [Undibacterium sp. CCC2.1]MEB0171490.1 MarR family transcriptional regulator [Undibacterium sp. CCC1.1]MEB0175439.1 MarR family transcriptional regulator [Undibacterium sp. CCC3.4]MEB0214690.1 MarR family transcriptional regulator [Undibacterium sp. 5I2]WPX43349.1 MarR family transcriptional regulator [Undibacterium sp. CCC3.4]